MTPRSPQQQRSKEPKVSAVVIGMAVVMVAVSINGLVRLKRGLIG